MEIGNVSGMSQMERTGVLILRVWIDRPAGDRLRARITSEQQLGSGERISVAADSVGGVVDVVRRWIDDFIATGIEPL